jgi:hypothetical protein
MLALLDEFRLAVYYADIEACRAERSPKSCRPQVEPSARDYIADDAGCASCWPAPPTRTHETWPLAVCLRRRAGGFSALRCCRPGRDAVKERVTSRKRVRTLCVWRRLARVRVVCDGGFEGGCRAFEVCARAIYRSPIATSTRRKVSGSTWKRGATLSGGNAPTVESVV